MDFSQDYTGRLKGRYTSRGIAHDIMFRSPTVTAAIALTGTVGAAFKATIHNTETVSSWSYAEPGSNVFLPIAHMTGSTGPGGRSGGIADPSGLSIATQRTLAGRTALGSKWRCVMYNALNADYDDFKLNPDQWDAADIAFKAALLAAGLDGTLIGSDGSAVLTVYSRLTISVNDHWLAVARRTRNS